MAGWVTGGYPGGSVQLEAGDDFTWKQSPCKLVLHTTETAGFPDYPRGMAPHVTVNPRNRQWRQHRRLDQPAWALAVGPVSTNSMGAIQIEIVGYAATTKNLSGPDLDYLCGFIRFIMDQTGIPIQCSVLFGGGETYGPNGPKRLSSAAWTAYRGILGHQHVPGNSHWDPGDLPMQAVWLPKIKGDTSPTPAPEPEEEEDMSSFIHAPKGIAYFGPGYFRHLQPDEVFALQRAEVAPQTIKTVTDADYDSIKSATTAGVGFAVEADVDTDAIANAVVAEIVASGRTLSDADVARIRAEIATLKSQFIA